ncbi:Tartrate-resistant acid phosphatase type 5 [Boothiomyces macroporosus]|uniref:Tartrate-resistant acid phosphatase type 5 n=1 Tax=Boothiomyces macroporosus TaxID=261099 RepID=A0AAD5Y0S4_9FUNG|nr:Tartrate-resistant acid phosphatase type 5 [Boothiomyces macroporosus]
MNSILLLGLVFAQTKLSFMALGDWGADYHINELKAVGKQMDRYGTQRNAQFVIALGDNFYNSGVTSVTDPKWQNVWLDSFTGLTGQLPWYCILGNHDWYGNEEAEIQYSQIHPRWTLPDYFYTKTVKLQGFTVGFVFIDTDLLFYGYNGELAQDFKTKGWTIENQTHQKQLDWISSQLQQMQSYEYIIVLGHHHLVTCDGTGVYMGSLLSLFDQYKVSSYMYGHKHTLKSAKYQNTLFIQSGAGGQVEGLCTNDIQGSSEQWGASSYGFVAVDVTRSSLNVDFVDLNGNILHSTLIAPRK